MNKYKTYSEVVAAANDCGMTVEQFYWETPAEQFEQTDWTI